MKPYLLACILLLTGLLAACDAPDTIMANGAITLKGDAVSLHVSGAPKAVIHADGSFVVDGKRIALTPAERDLLTQYYQSVAAVHAAGVALGKAGLTMAAKAVAGTASSSSDKAAADVSERATNLSRDICKDSVAIKTAQDQLAAQLDAFKPYASIVGASDLDDCQKGDQANGSPVTP